MSVNGIIKDFKYFSHNSYLTFHPQNIVTNFCNRQGIPNVIQVSARSVSAIIRHYRREFTSVNSSRPLYIVRLSCLVIELHIRRHDFQRCSGSLGMDFPRA